MHKKSLTQAEIGLTQPENRSNSNFRTSTCLAFPKKCWKKPWSFHIDDHNFIGFSELFWIQFLAVYVLYRTCRCKLYRKLSLLEQNLIFTLSLFSETQKKVSKLRNGKPYCRTWSRRSPQTWLSVKDCCKINQEWLAVFLLSRRLVKLRNLST